MLGLLVTVGLAYRLARLDGRSRMAGWWSVLLILSAPILSGFPFAVRPDLVGIALQTGGIWLVLSALQAPRPGVGSLLGAYAAFGLAICVKQHNVVAPAITTGGSFRRLSGRCGYPGDGSCPDWSSRPRSWWSSTGPRISDGWRMSQAVFVAAADVGRVHPADWNHVRIIAIAVLGRTIGLIAVLTAATGGARGRFRPRSSGLRRRGTVVSSCSPVLRIPVPALLVKMFA